MKIVRKSWGSEEWLVNNELYCGKILNLKKGYRCSLHYHKNKDETFYILKGIVLMEYGDNSKALNIGDSIHLPPNTLHRFTGIKDSQIIEISTHHEDSDSYRVEIGGKANLPED